MSRVQVDADPRKTDATVMPASDYPDTIHLIEVVRALAPQVKELSETIEIERQLPQSLVLAMKEAGIFRMAVSRAYGGPELAPFFLRHTVLKNTQEEQLWR